MTAEGVSAFLRCFSRRRVSVAASDSGGSGPMGSSSGSGGSSRSGVRSPPGPSVRRTRLPALLLLLPHRVHSAAHHVLHGDGAGGLRQVRRQILLRRGRRLLAAGVGRFLLRRLRFRTDSLCFRLGCPHLFPLRLRLCPNLLCSSGGRYLLIRLFRLQTLTLLHGRRLRFRGTLHVPHQLLFPTAAVLRQDLLQREAVLRRRHIGAACQRII